MLRPFVYENSICVITGATGGIGSALTHALSEYGARLILTDIYDDKLSALTATLGRPDEVVFSIAADLSDPAAAQHICDTALAHFGVIAPPAQTAYSASKFALSGFTGALSHELRGQNIGVSLVLPGGVATDIARNARIPSNTDHFKAQSQLDEFQKLLKKHPDDAARDILKGIQTRKRRIIIGRHAHLAIAAARLFPTSYWSVLGQLSGNWKVNT